MYSSIYSIMELCTCIVVYTVSWSCVVYSSIYSIMELCTCIVVYTVSWSYVRV